MFVWYWRKLGHVQYNQRELTAVGKKIPRYSTQVPLLALRQNYCFVCLQIEIEMQLGLKMSRVEESNLSEHDLTQ